MSQKSLRYAFRPHPLTPQNRLSHRRLRLTLEWLRLVQDGDFQTLLSIKELTVKKARGTNSS